MSEFLKVRAKQAEDAKQKESQLDAIVIASDPKDLFDKAVEAALVAKLEKMGFTDSSMGALRRDEDVHEAVDYSTKFVHSVSKKLLPPTLRGGAQYHIHRSSSQVTGSIPFPAQRQGEGKGQGQEQVFVFGSKSQHRLWLFRQKTRARRASKRSKTAVGRRVLALLADAPSHTWNSILMHNELSQTRVLNIVHIAVHCQRLLMMCHGYSSGL